MRARPQAQAAQSPAEALRQALAGLRRALLAALAVSAVINVLTLTGSLYMLQVYDRVLASGSVPTLVALFAIVVVLHGFLALYDVLRARLLSRAGLGLDRALGRHALALSLRPVSGSGPSRRGEPLRDLDTVRGFLGGGAGTLLDLPWMPIFLGALFLVHPALGWLTVGGMALAVGLALLNHLLTRAAIARALLREEEERGLAARARQAAEAVAGLGMGPAILDRWQERRDAALQASQAAGEPGELLAGLSRATRMLLQSAILTLGAFLVIRGEISGGMIIASSILSGRALAPVDQMVGGWRTSRRAAIAARSLSRALAEAPAEPARVALPDPEGRLEVRGLTRLAGEGRPPVLDAVAFALEPGDGLAITGPSGSGKSTLARLIVGALAPDRGEVRLDGATLDQWDPAEVGRHLGYLPQAPDALAGTARDLIARFDPRVTDAEVIAAARLAGIHDLVLGLPQGYGTMIGGPDGLSLSGGQMQRLGLARALCRMPRLVVLDEPDAHLDAAGEAALVAAIRALRAAGSTVVVVAHRPATLAALNKALALEAGRVLRFGALDAAASAPEPGPEPAPRLPAAGMRGPGPALVPHPLATVAAPLATPVIVPKWLQSVAAAAAQAAELQPEPQPGSGLELRLPSASPAPPRVVAERMRRLAERRTSRQASPARRSASA